MNLQWEFPEFLLLFIPALWLFWQWGKDQRRTITAFRVVILSLFILALARPSLDLAAQGRDLIILVDRSSSLPQNADRRIKELVDHLQLAKNEADRIGVVSFGQGAGVEVFPERKFSRPDFIRPSGQTASDLAEGLELAQQLLPPRHGKIIVLSDGKFTGMDPIQQAARLSARRVKVDYRYLGRLIEGDLAIEDVSFPDQVEIGKPFQYSIWVHSPRSTEATITVSRAGQTLIETMKNLSSGKNRFVFRDIIPIGGTIPYKIEVKSKDDQLLENNVGLGVVRAEAGPAVLAITPEGRDDNLVRALRKSKIPLTVIPPDQAPTELNQLDRYRAVVIENVSANDLSASLPALRSFVENLGGGLLMTGGKQSFGVGGYYKSILEPALPVTMELRKEHHKLKVAIVVAMDRSGSMAAPAGGGTRTKMDLANLGTCSIIDLLTPLDEVGVIAVDSSPHTIIPLIAVEDPGSMKSRVLSVKSAGGGIYTYNALVAAAKMLSASDRETRHVILFADAADAEQPGKYKGLLSQMATENMTVSVIALGKKTDPDAKFLEDVAKRGGGRIFFAENAGQLPQLFAQEALTIAKSSFVDDPTQAKITSEYRLMGVPPKKAPSSVGGFNLTYLRPQASQGIKTINDEYGAPLFAFWYRGAGRAAVFTAEVDGKYTGALKDWDSYGDFFVSVTQWLVGQAPPGGYFVETRREGSRGAVYLEMEKAGATPPPLFVISPSGKKQAVEFKIYEKGFIAHFPLHEFGIYMPVLQVDERQVLRCPSVTLPYAPEFLPYIQARDGKKILAKLAKLTGGKEQINVSDALEGIERTYIPQLLTFYLCLIALILLVIEIALRRLGLVGALEALFIRIWTAVPSWRPRRKRKKAKIPSEKEAAEKDQPDEVPAPAATVEEKEEDEPGVSFLSRAKEQAKDRLDR